MTGLEKNKLRLMGRGGKLFLAAFDHPQIYGTMPGLENTQETIDRFLNTEVDGFILNPGQFALVPTEKVANKKMVLRASVGGTNMGTSYPDKHDVIVSPETALALGADAILIMLVLGGSMDKESMVEAAHAAEAFHKYSIPVIMEVLAADYSKNNDSDFIASGARIGAELGADMIKAFYCDDFKKVTSNCPVPVILAGGPKDQDIVRIAAGTVRDGGKGFAFGRNLFQSENPETLVSALDKALRG